ncbi:GspH/FimT family protein [soil metagenome]
MIQRNQGFSLLELIMVIAIVGIFAALGFGRLPKDRVEVQQAARSYVSSVQKARFEAISRNAFVGIKAGSGGFTIFCDSNRDGTFTSADFCDFNGDGTFTPGEEFLSNFTIGSGDYPSVALSVTTGNGQLVFDPRGVAHEASASSLRFASSRDSGYALQAAVSGQGRVKVDKKL